MTVTKPKASVGIGLAKPPSDVAPPSPLSRDAALLAAAPDTRGAQKASIRPFTYRAPQSRNNKLPKGGYFAAWEQPKLFSEEMRAGFKSLRS